MASAFGHALFAGALGSFNSKHLKTFRFWLLIVIASVIPDADVIAFKLGIPYEHPLGHRGFSHSLLFSILFGVLLTFLFYRKESKQVFFKLSFFFALGGISHSFLDCMTTGGLGVGWFIPFDNSRYFFPFRPIEVSPISVKAFFTMRGVSILLNEAIWIGGMSLILVAVRKIKRPSRKKASKS